MITTGNTVCCAVFSGVSQPSMASTGRTVLMVEHNLSVVSDLSDTITVLRRGEPWGEVRTPLTGAFNVRNCLAVIAAAESVGAGREGVLEGLRTFRSVKRRMEVRGTVRGVTVIDGMW